MTLKFIAGITLFRIDEECSTFGLEGAVGLKQLDVTAGILKSTGKLSLIPFECSDHSKTGCLITGS